MYDNKEDLKSKLKAGVKAYLLAPLLFVFVDHSRI